MKCSTLMLCIGITSIFVTNAIFAKGSTLLRKPSKEKFTREAEATWKTHHGKIEKEIVELKNHPWAGTYYYGDGFGVNASITLAPNNGYVFIWRGCTGVHDRNYGDVTPTGRGSLIFDFTYEKNKSGIQRIAEELVPIAWGKRQYLIPLDGIIGFCNAVNSNSEPRRGMHGDYYLRRGDHEKPIHGAPKVPERYRAYLLNEPILAEIIAITTTSIEEKKYGSTHITTITLNVGKSSNVLPGMSFQVYEPTISRRVAGTTKILSVSENTCDAIINQFVGNNMKPTPPTVGWKLTTGSRYDFTFKSGKQ